MLTDAILSEAAAEAERFLLSIVPEDGEPHVFSKRFERKMQKLICRTDHPVRYQVMRIAAAVVLAIVTLFGAVMAVSPEVRAAVAGWVKSTFFEFYEYSNDASSANSVSTSEDGSINNPTSDPVKYEYRLATAPEGYQEIKVIERLDGKTYIYKNTSGNMLQFTYTYGTENSSLFAKTAEYEQVSGFVNNMPADIYLATSENRTSVIVWQDPHHGTLFEIFALADKTELLTFAETVIRVDQ